MLIINMMHFIYQYIEHPFSQTLRWADILWVVHWRKRLLRLLPRPGPWSRQLRKGGVLGPLGWYVCKGRQERLGHRKVGIPGKFTIFWLATQPPSYFQVQQHPDYNMGVPLKPIKLAIEEPKPGDLVVTVAHKAIRGFKIRILDWPKF